MASICHFEVLCTWNAGGQAGCVRWRGQRVIGSVTDKCWYVDLGSHLVWQGFDLGAIQADAFPTII
jgi:hypothetical protein